MKSGQYLGRGQGREGICAVSDRVWTGMCLGRISSTAELQPSVPIYNRCRDKVAIVDRGVDAILVYAVLGK